MSVNNLQNRTILYNSNHIHFFKFCIILKKLDFRYMYIYLVLQFWGLHKQLKTLNLNPPSHQVSWILKFYKTVKNSQLNNFVFSAMQNTNHEQSKQHTHNILNIHIEFCKRLNHIYIYNCL